MAGNDAGSGDDRAAMTDATTMVDATPMADAATMPDAASMSDSPGSAETSADGASMSDAASDAGLPWGQLTRSPTNPLVPDGMPGTFDSLLTGVRTIVKMGPGDYRMWYEAVGSNFVGNRVAYATSTDAVTWTKRGVVIAPDQPWESTETAPGTVLFEGGVFKLWYHGGATSTAGGTYSPNESIGYATSPDGLTWTKYSGNPILSHGTSGSFDLEAANPVVFNLGALGLGTGYRMYYTGSATGTSGLSLAMATSPDGISWTKYAANPIIANARWGGAWGGALIPADGVWNLWYGTADGNSGLNYAYSSDGIGGWADGPSNPVLTPPSDPTLPDAMQVGGNVSGYLDGTIFRILYSGYSSNYQGSRFEGICMATIVQP
jgi:hypothetical protein